MVKIISFESVVRFSLIFLATSVLLGAMASGKAYASPANLVALWHFDEDTDDNEIAKDSSDNGNDGKLLGGEYIEGMFGDALQFNGSGDNGVIVEHKPSQELKDQITVEAWVMPIVAGDYACIIRKGIYNVAGSLGWSIDTGTGLAVREFMYLKGGLALISGAVTLKIGEWHHLAFTYDKKELKGYSNGELFQTIAATSDLTECEEGIGIGIRVDSSSGFNGAIDEVAVWSKARTQEQIKEDMLGITTDPVEALGKLATTWGKIKTY